MQTEDDTIPSEDDLDVFGDQPEDPGDGEAEVTEPEEPAPVDAEADEPEEVQPIASEEDKGGQVPAWRLRELREERDQINARAEAAERQAQEAARRLAQMERQWQEAQQRQEQPPNLYDDPDGYRGYFEQQVNQRVQSVEQAVQAKLIDMTFDEQKEQHPEEFEKAWTALKLADGRGDPEVRRITAAPNPGKALMRWHRQRSALSEVGDDLPGYLEKQKAAWLADPEVRKQVIAAAREEAAQAGRSSVNPTGIPSLNATPGGGRGTTPDQSGDEMLSEAFGVR